MKKEFLWWILVGVAINRACSILPVGVYFDPFPLYEMEISLQTYVYMITIHLAVMATWYGLTTLKNEYREIFKTFLIIELASLIDFFLIYEHPWFHIGNYGVEFTDAKILLYSYYILRWNGNSNT